MYSAMSVRAWRIPALYKYPYYYYYYYYKKKTGDCFLRQHVSPLLVFAWIKSHFDLRKNAKQTRTIKINGL